MSAELNENEFDLSQKAVGISIGGSGSGQTQIGGSGGNGGEGGSGSGGSGGSGSGGNGGEGGSGSGGNGGENGNGGDEEDGEENPAEEQEEGDSEDEQDSQEDSRVGQRCVIIYPEEFAGLIGVVKRVVWKGKPDTPIQPRKIGWYNLTYPSETEFTLFEVDYNNLKGEIEYGFFMDIDVLFENQTFFGIVGEDGLEEVCKGFVESISPNKYLIETESGNRFPASSCFISPEQLNTQNQNNSEDGESDEDEDAQDNEQENSIVGKEFVVLGSGKKGVIEGFWEDTLGKDYTILVNGTPIIYPQGTKFRNYETTIGTILSDFNIVFVGEEISFVISDENEYEHTKGIYEGREVLGFYELHSEEFYLKLDVSPSLISPDMCFVTAETIALRNQTQDSQDDDDDDDEQTPENEENAFVASLFWNYVLNERKLSGDVFTADIDENFREVTNELSFLRSFPASLYDESVIYSKETKEYGYLTTNEFDVKTIQTIDYFAVTNFNLFESVIYRNNPKELNFTYVALKYVLDNLKRKMFFVPTYQVNEESFYIMVYEKNEDEIIFVATHEKFSVRKNGLGDYLHLITFLLTSAYLNRFEPNLFLDFKKQTENLLKPNIFYAKIFEDYCKALTI